MRRIPLIAALALFLAVALWYGRPIDGVWNSPDETANAFWAARVASGEPLRVEDALVASAAGVIHPRSMVVSGGALVPGSFPGIILLYGVFTFLFKIPFFIYTPILTALAGLCLGLLVSRLFDRKVGFWTAALFFVHPAVLYYGARGMFHNVLFIDAVVFAAALFVLRPLSTFFGARALADDAMGGFILAWALVIRTSEAVWVLPAFAAFLPFAGKQRWRRLAIALIGALVPIIVFMRINATLYGSPFRTAYSSSAPVAAETESVAPTAEPAVTPATILPFGLHPRLAAHNVWNYGLKLFWWQSILAAAGFAWWIYGYRKATSPQKVYALAALLTAAWLAALYGSWRILDRFDPADVTVGTSYVRYFLPAYVASLPFAALALVRFAGLVRKPAAIPAVLVLCAAFSVHLTVFAGDESLRAVRRTLEGNAVKKATLLEWIEPEAVVMTERFDKLLVPERLRIIPTTDAGAFAAAARAAAYAPAYWYGLEPSEAEEARLVALAEAQGLAWFEVGRPIPGEALFGLEPLGGSEDEETFPAEP
ncbi:MAG TPA: hypothetical protein VL283_05905 [Candidatus Baltobacteraceae bacterium]|nr:hypothetical protein [Candidatus Baltobacteraceae bacterium]